MLDERTQEQPPDQPAEAVPGTPTTADEGGNGRPPEEAAREASAAGAGTQPPEEAAVPPEAAAPPATASAGSQADGSLATPSYSVPPAPQDAPASLSATSPPAEAISPSVANAPEAAPSGQTAEPASAEGERPVAEAEPASAEGDRPVAEADPGPADAPSSAAPEATPQQAPRQPRGGSQPGPAGKRAARVREPLPWPELRAAAGVVSQSATVEELKDLFRLLPTDVRDETVENVREYRKGARRPVSAFAGKSLARAVHTARRARRRPESDDAVSEALGQALAAEIIASLEVEIAAEVILPKRDLLEREARNARRRQRDEDVRTRDDRRRQAREAGAQQGGTFGTYSGAKIRGLDELKKLFDDQQGREGG